MASTSRFLMALVASAAAASAAPVITTLKPLYPSTTLAKGGAAQCLIVVPAGDEYVFPDIVKALRPGGPGVALDHPADRPEGVRVQVSQGVMRGGRKERSVRLNPLPPQAVQLRLRARLDSPDS